MIDYARILDQVPVGIWVARTPEGRAEFANAAFREIMGMPASAESVIADAPATYSIHGRDGKPYPVERLPFSRALATRGPVVVDDMVIHRADGRRVNLRAFGHPLLDAAGTPTHVIVAFIDITREVRVEVERDSVEGKLALAINHAPIVIWTADPSGVVTLSEGAGLKSLGVVSGQLVGQNLFALYKDHPTIPGFIRRAIEGDSFSYTVQVGEAIYDTWLAPIRDGTGRVTGIAGLSNDVSEVRKLQDKAVQNDRVIAVGTLAASVAHEVNNPLTYMLGHLLQAGETLEALGRAVGEAGRREVEELRSHLETIRRGAERMAVITRELRTFSRPDERTLRTVSVSHIVRSVLRLVGKDLEARAQAVVELRDTPPVIANEAGLVQAVLNLVVNAMQAMEGRPTGQGRIEIRTLSEGNDVIVEVADDGPGVAAADRERIFDAFFSTKEIGKGTGLGLFVSRNVVRAASGDLTVGERPGGGARFLIRLPRAVETGAGAPEAGSGGAAEPATARTARILVIDDEPLVAGVLVQKLRQAGYAAEEIHEGAAALRTLLSGGYFDLVFCDLMMRGMNGMALAAELERRAPETARRLVFMTGGAFTPEAQRFVESHAGRVVDKPFDILAETRRRLPG